MKECDCAMRTSNNYAKEKGSKQEKEKAFVPLSVKKPSEEDK